MGRCKVTVRKVNLDRRVAMALGVRQRDVARITRAFLDEIREGLVESGIVCLDGVGMLRVVERVGAHVSGGWGKKAFVSFRKSDVLAAAIKDGPR